MSQVDVETIYYIDDCADEFLITRLLLERDGLKTNVMSYSSYGEFEIGMNQTDPASNYQSIVAVDLNLVLNSGIDVVQSMRRDDRYEGMIIGICTGSDDPKDRKDALEAGADFFVTKPLSADTLGKICEAVPSLSLSRRDGETIEIKRTKS